jgi:alkylhydroperoxidase/carboxymuconolactone decarboxylase family protein YurZ
MMHLRTGSGLMIRGAARDVPWRSSTAMGSERTLRSLALNDEPSLQAALLVELEHDHGATHGVDSRTKTLVRLGALVATGAAPASYGWSVDAALAAGATVDEIVGTLLAIAPVVGIARVVAAAEPIAGAIGYDVEAAFEGSDLPRR